MRYFTDAFSKYAVFRGRADRAQFWVFILIVWIITGLAVWLTGGRAADGSVSFIAYLVGLVFLLPTVSVTVRRLHDTNRTGWWWWISLVPFIGQIWLLILLVLAGTPGPNRYGPQPR